jgi:diadenosine tetraphosphate (Ap4A) HIT family hydrolase
MEQVEKDSCELCSEFQDGKFPYDRSIDSRILGSDKFSVTLPTLGCFVEGYVLVCPFDHFRSIAAVDAEEIGGLLTRFKEVRELVEERFGETVVFEHGMSETGSGGGCIDHAHLHILPSTPDIQRSLLSVTTFSSPIPWEEISKMSHEEYLLLSLPEDKGFRMAPIPPGLTSQEFRRRAAENLGVEYDWALNPCYPNISMTIDSLGKTTRDLYLGGA